MKILYIGSGGDLSLQPLLYLLQGEHQVCAVAVALQDDVGFSDPRLPVFTEQKDSVETLARVFALPVINMSSPEQDCLATIAGLAPDLILVSCYGKKLPQEILTLAPYGCFNFHPSALPAYRGPVPMFWQFRDGLSEFGVSLHRMTEKFDAGPIVARSTVNMPDGVSQARASQLLAHAYVELLPDFLRALVNKTLVENVQDESATSYQPYPEAEDFRVDTRWSARRLFNFICGTRNWGCVYPCTIAETDYALQDVLGYSEEQCPDENCVIDGDTIEIACSPGVLLARLASV
jgi:methionyl-tRNA formyltransferase